MSTVTHFGVIQQLRGLNVTQSLPPAPFKWSIVNILYTTYPFLTWPNVDLLLTTFVQELIE